MSAAWVGTTVLVTHASTHRSTQGIAQAIGRRPYTSTMTPKTDRDRDLVEELHEDARWSTWTNTIPRWRIGRRDRVPSDPGIRTFMLAAILVVGAVAGGIALIVLLLSTS